MSFHRVSDDEAAARRRLAELVAQELQRAGLTVVWDATSDGGAEIEVDQGADGAGGVFVTWHPGTELAVAASTAVDSGELDAPVIEQAGAVALIMRQAILELLLAAGFDATATEVDDTRPLAVRVT